MPNKLKSALTALLMADDPRQVAAIGAVIRQGDYRDERPDEDDGPVDLDAASRVSAWIKHRAHTAGRSARRQTTESEGWDESKHKRDDDGKFGSGGGQSSSSDDDDDHAEYKAEVARIDHEHATAVSNWQAEVDAIDAEWDKQYAEWQDKTDALKEKHAEEKEKWDTQVKALDDAYQEAQTAWEAREGKRKGVEAALEVDAVSTATDTAKSEMGKDTLFVPFVDAQSKDKAAAWQAYKDRSAGYGSRWTKAFSRAFSKHGLLHSHLERIRASDDEIAKVVAMGEKGVAAMEKAAAKHEKAAAKHVDFVEGPLAKHLSGPRPDDTTDEAWDEKWYAKDEELNDKEAELENAAVETAQALDDLWDSFAEKMDATVSKIAARVERDLEKEAEEDPEPEEPEYPEEPEEPDYDDPPDDPEYPEEPEREDYPDAPDKETQESCVPNKGGKGHHDDETGYPCNPDGARSSATDDGGSQDSSSPHETFKSIGVNENEPLSNEQHEALSQQAEGKAKRILKAMASLPSKVVPQKVKDVTSKVRGAVVAGLTKRYGEKGAAIILKVVALSAPVPVPGSQPLAIVASLVVAEGVLAYRKIRDKFRKAAEAYEADMTAGELIEAAKAAAKEIVDAIKAELKGVKDETQEACVPNQKGKGYHDDRTGHPCSTRHADPKKARDTGYKHHPSNVMRGRRDKPKAVAKAIARLNAHEYTKASDRTEAAGAALLGHSWVSKSGSSGYDTSENLSRWLGQEAEQYGNPALLWDIKSSTQNAVNYSAARRPRGGNHSHVRDGERAA